MYGIYANIKGVIDGIHGTPYIAAPWIRHGLQIRPSLVNRRLELVTTCLIAFNINDVFPFFVPRNLNGLCQSSLELFVPGHS